MPKKSSRDLLQTFFLSQKVTKLALKRVFFISQIHTVHRPNQNCPVNHQTAHGCQRICLNITLRYLNMGLFKMRKMSLKSLIFVPYPLMRINSSCMNIDKSSTLLNPVFENNPLIICQNFSTCIVPYHYLKKSQLIFIKNASIFRYKNFPTILIANMFIDR